MWIYLNQLNNKQSTVVPHGQVVRQGDGFDIYLAFDYGEIQRRRYQGFNLTYILPGETEARSFHGISSVEQIMFTKLHDAEVTYGLKDGTSYDVVKFTIYQRDLLTSESGNLKIQFEAIRQGNQENINLTSYISIYVEPSLDYVKTLSETITQSEAAYLLDLIRRNTTPLELTFEITNNQYIKDGVFKISSVRGITSFFGYCEVIQDTGNEDLTKVAELDCERMTPKTPQMFIGGKSVNNGIVSDREGWLYYADNKLHFYIGPAHVGDQISFNGNIFIKYEGAYETTDKYKFSKGFTHYVTNARQLVLNLDEFDTIDSAIVSLSKNAITTSGNYCNATIQSINDNEIVISFSESFTGTVYLIAYGD